MKDRFTPVIGAENFRAGNMAGKIDILKESPVLPKTQTFSEMGGSPPEIPTGRGMHDHDPEDEAKLDRQIFWSLTNAPFDQQLEFAGIIEKYGLFPEVDTNTKVSDSDVKKFIDRARKAGLIKQKRLSLRQYIGALLPLKK